MDCVLSRVATVARNCQLTRLLRYVPGPQAEIGTEVRANARTISMTLVRPTEIQAIIKLTRLEIL